MRRDLGDEVEFVTIMTFNTHQDVIDFQGADHEACYVPDAARIVLSRWNQHSPHYNAIERRG